MLDGSCLTPLFWGNNRQHMLVCGKIISSSWVRKVLSTAKSVVFGHSQDAMAPAALVAGVSLVTILQAGEGTEFLFPLGTIFKHISLLQIGSRILCCMLSWTLVSSQPIGKCQTLTYIVLQICWAVRL